MLRVVAKLHPNGEAEALLAGMEAICIKQFEKSARPVEMLPSNGSNEQATQQAEGSNSGKPLYAPPNRLPSLTSSHQAASSSSRLPFDEKDERVYFDQQSKTWRCEVEGEEIEWDQFSRAWVPVVDEDTIKKQQAAYSVEGVDEETPAEPVLRRERKRQRDAEAGPSSKPAKQAKARINTSIFVSGLPLDCSKEEIVSVFSRYGVLNEDDTGEARVKMYADTKTGMFKGEALVTYFKPESVDLAVRVLDESCLRAAEGQRDPIMKVQRAEFGGSNGKEDTTELAQNPQAKKSEDSNGQVKVRTEAEKRKAQKRFAKMNNKLTDWNSDSDSELEDKGKGTTGQSSDLSSVRQVCLRRMFTLAEIDEDPSLILDLKDDVREECETLGKVTNVVLWDKEPEGIMTVKFGTHDAALACVQKMDQRFFAGRQVIAHLLEGKARFRRSGRTGEEEGEDDNDEDQQRQDAFGTWLEAGGDGEASQ